MGKRGRERGERGEGGGREGTFGWVGDKLRMSTILRRTCKQLVTPFSCAGHPTRVCTL